MRKRLCKSLEISSGSVRNRRGLQHMQRRILTRHSVGMDQPIGVLDAVLLTPLELWMANASLAPLPT